MPGGADSAPAGGGAGAAPTAAPPPRPLPHPVRGVLVPGSLELRHDAARGHHVAATRDLAAGTTLLLEAPFAACTAAAGSLPSHCQRCLAALASAPSNKRASCDRWATRRRWCLGTVAPACAHMLSEP
jgi:hypothetical protein